MSKNDLTVEQKAELDEMLSELNELAKEVFKDYETNPSEMSGSVTQIHENSPFLVTKEERLLKPKK